MNGNEHLRQTLEYYRQQRQKKLEELRPIDAMIRNLEKDLGEAPQNGGESAGLPLDEPEQIIRQTPQTQAVIRPDEFYGMSQSEAAKAYLRKVRHAVHLDELVESLNKGGAQVGGANPKRTLYVSLMRNPLKEFVSPSENHIGLREFYPSLPKAAKPAWGKKDKKAKRKKSKAARPTKKKISRQQVEGGKQTQQGEPRSGNIGLAVRELMSDGKPRTKEDIFKEVEARLGHSIAPIAVYGTLRGKAFREVDGQVSLVR